MTDRFVTEREFAVSPEVLFEAWTDVTVLTRWFGCGNDMLWNVHAWDVREGGAIAVSLDFDGKLYDVCGEFLIVDRPADSTIAGITTRAWTSRSCRAATVRCFAWNTAGRRRTKIARCSRADGRAR